MEIGNRVSNNGILLSLTVLITNFSQLPYLVENQITQLINYPIWICLIIYSFLKMSRNISKEICLFVLLGFAFIFGQILSTAYYQNFDYIATSLSVPYYMSLVVLIVSYLIAKNKLTHNDMNCIFETFVLSAMVLAVNIFINIMANDVSLIGSAYAYSSKNSVSQILFTGFLIIAICLHRNSNNITKNIILIVSAIFLTVVLVMLKSRATLLGYVIFAFYYLYFEELKTKIKLLFCFLSIIFFVYIYGGIDIIFFFIDNFVMAGRDINDLDSLSSNRISIIKTFPYLIDGHEILGIGDIYFECFYLSAYLQHGIFGFILILTALLPIYFSYKNFERNNSLSELLLLITITYAINGVFEGVAPFGPGSKCYFLWMILGVTIGKNVIKLGRYNLPI